MLHFYQHSTYKVKDKEEIEWCRQIDLDALVMSPEWIWRIDRSIIYSDKKPQPWKGVWGIQNLNSTCFLSQKPINENQIENRKIQRYNSQTQFNLIASRWRRISDH